MEVTPRQEKVRPSARVPVAVAERRRFTRPGRGLGGHSVDVPLRIYAKCIDGQDAIAKRRISEALREDAPDMLPPITDVPATEDPRDHEDDQEMGNDNK